MAPQLTPWAFELVQYFETEHGREVKPVLEGCVFSTGRVVTEFPDAHQKSAVGIFKNFAELQAAYPTCCLRHPPPKGI